MGLLAKIETHLIKKTVVKSTTGNFEIVITQWKESYKGVSLYRVFSEIRLGKDIVEAVECYSTYDRKASDDYFYRLEGKYPENRRTRIIG